MDNQKRIDAVLEKILKSRKLSPQKIEALASVIAALSQVKPPVEKIDNKVKEEPNGFDEELVPPSVISELHGVQIDDGEERKVQIIPN